MANDLSTRPEYPGYLGGDRLHVHRPGAPNTDYKATPAQAKPFLDAAGVSHSSLTDLEADTHPQYLNQDRGDTRYYTKSAIDDTVSVLDSRLISLENAPDGSTIWGGITGELADQTDLADALAAKRNLSDPIPAADVSTTSSARFITDTELAKLAGIEAGAQVNQTAETIANALDAYLGSSSWRTGGGGSGSQVLAVLYNSVDGASIAASATGYTNYDTFAYKKSDADITVADNEITINDTGKFLIYAKVTVSFSTSNTRGFLTYNLQTNASGSWADIGGAKDLASEAGTSSTVLLQNGRAAVHAYLNLTTSGTKIRLKATSTASVSAAYHRAECCQLVIQKVETEAGGGGGGDVIITGDVNRLLARTSTGGTSTTAEWHTDTATILLRDIARRVSSVGPVTSPWAPALGTTVGGIIRASTSANLTIDPPTGTIIPTGWRLEYTLEIQNTASGPITVALGSGFNILGLVPPPQVVMPNDIVTVTIFTDDGGFSWWAKGLQAYTQTWKFYFPTLAATGPSILRLRLATPLRVPAIVTDIGATVSQTPPTEATSFILKRETGSLGSPTVQNVLRGTFNSGERWVTWAMWDGSVWATPSNSLAVTYTEGDRLVIDGPSNLNGLTNISWQMHVAAYKVAR